MLKFTSTLKKWIEFYKLFKNNNENGKTFLKLASNLTVTNFKAL